jgi:GrpB-like predicted nucleotidyltransferase (UPF0157 family)
MRDDASFGLGLKNQTVSLAEPNALWHDAYEGEAEAIRQALGDMAIDIQHVGSTAVPGIKAKPIIEAAASRAIPEPIWFMSLNIAAITGTG